MTSSCDPQILQALALIHDSTTPNTERRQASEYLEHIKTNGGFSAIDQGFAIADDHSLPPSARHFGLTLLEHGVRNSHDLNGLQNETLRTYIVRLGTTSSNAPTIIKNKIAGLWVELAKRSWALDWFDLDATLCGLWYHNHQDFVLTVLENLSDDVFVREDTTAVLRGKDLNAALVEIFTSSTDFESTRHVRSGKEGWLHRICQYLQSTSNDLTLLEEGTMVRALATLRSSFGWVMSTAVVSAGALAATCSCLMKQREDIIIAALDALIALFGRHLEDSEVRTLAYPLCTQDSTGILQQVYTWSVVTIDDVDSPKYLISKKLSELVSLLAEHLARFEPPKVADLDITAFLRLLIEVASHDSLIVSIPAIHSWVKMLEVSAWRRSSKIEQFVAPVLEVVCSRMIQYDQLPNSGNGEAAVRFVDEEIEIHHERSGFFLNYRRLCIAVIEWICYTHLEQALEFVLGRVLRVLTEIKHADETVRMADYQRLSVVSLQADAQFAIVEAAFKGFDRWQTAHTDRGGAEGQQLGQRLREAIKAWATKLHTDFDFRDPQIKQRQIKTMVETSSRALQKDTAFALIVLEHILASFIPPQPNLPAYTDAVNELHSYGTAELRRLALYHANYFVTFYDQLRQKFTELVSNVHVDPKIQVDLKSVLFLIVQRAHTDKAEQQKETLWPFLEPLKQAWESGDLQSNVSSFDAYSRSQGFDDVGPHLISADAQGIEDWTAADNTEAGRRLQQNMTDAFYAMPLRETRVLLSLSTERLEQDTAEHKAVTELWMSFLDSMLSAVLKITSYNHMLHDPANWRGLALDQLQLTRRILRDRYWQSGISEGSMNEFHAKVKSSKTSLEGFASSVRARIRINLEQCYSIIHTLGRLGAPFFSLEKLPPMIAQNLIASSSTLSPHHFAIMLAMMPKLIEECPPSHRQHFLTPILAELLLQMDQKLTAEWESIGQKKAETHAEEDLNSEMRDDSVLRQTTYRAVNMVASWLDSKREEQLSAKKGIVNGAHLTNGDAPPSSSIREYALTTKPVLERLLPFMTHALTYRDTKSAHTILNAAQRTVPHFIGEQAVLEYISEYMLRAALLCIHDGYFADLQQYYALLIAYIWYYYGLPRYHNVQATGGLPGVVPNAMPELPALSQIPVNLLRSIPGLEASRVDATGEMIIREGTVRPKRLRALVLDLLEPVRGVRVSELGKVDSGAQKSRILELYMRREAAGGMEIENGRPETDNTDYGGIADMLG